jgi:hypothetical protein
VRRKIGDIIVQVSIFKYLGWEISIPNNQEDTNNKLQKFQLCAEHENNFGTQNKGTYAAKILQKYGTAMPDGLLEAQIKAGWKHQSFGSYDL